METSEDTEKPSSPVEQATPDSALSEEDTQEDKLEPPTPPPSTNFETPVPEGTEPEVPHDIQVKSKPACFKSQRRTSHISLAGRCCSEAGASSS